MEFIQSKIIPANIEYNDVNLISYSWNLYIIVKSSSKYKCLRLLMVLWKSLDIFQEEWMN
jgi:hypothetical protein